MTDARTRIRAMCPRVVRRYSTSSESLLRMSLRSAEMLCVSVMNPG